MAVEPFRVLVAVDFSEQARLALDWALAHSGAERSELHVLHVVQHRLADIAGELEQERVGVEMERLERTAREELEKMLPAGLHPIPPVRHIALGDPAHEILRVAERIGADMIVLGSHGRAGVTRFLLGSTAEKVLRHAEAIVVCFKPRRARKQ